MRGQAMTTRGIRRAVAVAMLTAAGVGLFGGCSTAPIPPTYTDAELKDMCLRKGGWWRGDLIAGYCEFQSASLP